MKLTQTVLQRRTNSLYYSKVELFYNIMFLKKGRQKIIDFINSHELSEGGYSLGPYVPPSLEDTYYALQSLLNLGIHRISPATVAYIKEIAEEGSLSYFKLAYHLAILIKKYNIKAKPVMLKSILEKFHPKSASDWYYLIMFKIICGKKIDLNEDLISWIKDQTPEKLRYVTEVGRYVLLMEKLKLDYDRKRYINWLRLLQNPDGGFGPLFKTTSFLEHAYIALKALNSLGSKPIYIRKLREFITTSQAKKGGFGRQSITVPTLEYTYYALISLLILSDSYCKSI